MLCMVADAVYESEPDGLVNRGRWPEGGVILGSRKAAAASLGLWEPSDFHSGTKASQLATVAAAGLRTSCRNHHYV